MAYNREQRRAEREGLLDSVLPAPTHPRAKPRALATCVLAIFFVLVIWMAATESSNANKDKKGGWAPSMQRWVWQGDGGGNIRTATMKEQQAVNQEEELQTLDEAEQATSSDAVETDSEDENVDAEMKSSLAKYIWHEDLEWDADGSGRLIVVGDVHGMIGELK